MPDVASLPLMLKALRLSTMAEHWEEIQAQALEANWPLGQALCVLCEEELAARDRRRLERYLKESNLPAAKALHNLDFEACPGIPRQQVVELSQDATWTERAENLVLFGPSGVGKTHVATAIGHGLVTQGVRVRFSSATALVQELQVAKKELKLAGALSKLDKYRVLVLDDIGYVKRTEMETSVLFELIAHRYESASLVVTSNHPFSKWDEIFQDTMMAVAAIDRLVHHAKIIEIHGKSYRKRQSLDRSGSTHKDG